MLDIAQAANKHMYSSVVKANREKEMMNRVEDQDDEHVITE